MSRLWHRNGWTEWHLVFAVLLMAAAVVVTYQPWSDIIYLAMRDTESSHIFLVPIIAVWMVMVRWGRVRHVHPGGEWVGVAISVAGALFSYFGYQDAVQSFWHLGAVLLVVGAMLSVLGWQVLVNFLPAFVVLAFLVPVPGTLRQQISIPLQTTTAQVTENILGAFGADVQRSGNVLTINGQDVGVVEACNGMRGIFALVLVSYAFAFGTPLRWYVRLIVMGLSPLLALVCNIIRLLPTVWFYGYMSKPQADFLHETSGWLMLPMGFLMLMAIIRVLRWALIPVETFTLAYD